MEKLFLTALSMSVTGAAVTVAVLLARLALRGAPKIFSYALWAVVLFRLLCPFTLKSPFSLAPDLSAEPLMANQTVHIYPGDDMPYVLPTPVPDVSGQAPLALPEGVSGVPAAFVPEKASGLRLSVAVSWVWLAGAALLLGYSLCSLLRLRRRLVGWVPLEREKNVRLADHIPSPFVLGVIRPKIYLPSDLPENERDYILLHERTHILRGDHILRALAWLAVVIHWFNPLVWLAFHLAGQDMEMACDEAVLRKMGRDIRAEYSSSLLRLSQGGRLPAGPLAFGGGGPQSRIKNVLSYKKPAVWVMALALAGVACVGVALATDPSDLISPNSVRSVTMFEASSYTITPQGTVVYTAADRQKDLDDPADAHVLSGEDGAELIRLINLYRRSVYMRGEPGELDGKGHHFHRIDCAGGDFYLLDFWYWNGFSFHPLHFGEDSYTTLVTHYDAQGNAGTTWQMEYSFDRAYREWRSGVSLPSADPGEGVPGQISLPGADLTFTWDAEGEEPSVRMEGSVGGVAVPRGTFWSPPHLFPEYPCGWLSMAYPAFAGGANIQIHAGWTDESRTSVMISTRMEAALSGQPHAGYWTVTVALSGEGGTVTDRVLHDLNEQKYPIDQHAHPANISDEEAVKAARVAARLLTAAEEYYRGSTAAGVDGLTADLTFTLDMGEEDPYVRMDGSVGNVVLKYGAFWHPERGRLIMEYPLLEEDGGPLIDACWTNESHSAVTVTTAPTAMLSSWLKSGSLEFTVDLSERRVVSKEGYLPNRSPDAPDCTITDERAVEAARAAAKLLTAAEDYYRNRGAVYDAPQG